MTLRKLTSLDAQFLAMEDGRAHGHVSVLSTFAPTTADGRQLTADVIRDLVTERLPLLPPFRWQLVKVPFDLDHPYWADADDVDVTYHVQESALWAPGDDRRLAEHVAEIVARPLDRSRPLWEIHVISGLADGSVALLIKMHHAVVDGVSGAELLRERPLHAKCLLLEGEDTTLAYVGSANFTSTGWGFGATSNVEAGVALVKAWGLPETFVDAVGGHHADNFAGRDGAEHRVDLGREMGVVVDEGRATVGRLIQAQRGRVGRRKAPAVHRRRAVPRHRRANKDVLAVLWVDRDRADRAVLGHRQAARH